MLKSIKIDDNNNLKPLTIKSKARDKKSSFIENYLNGFAINESPEEEKKRYKILVYTHTGLACFLLIYSVLFIYFDQTHCPKEGEHNLWMFLLTPCLNVITSIFGILSLYSCHRYSNSHAIYAFIHCLLLGLMVLKTINSFIHIVMTSQDWFVNFDDDVHSKFWRSLLSWMSVILMNLLVANEVICAILAYILGRYGIFFFILAYVLGKFVPI